MKLSVNPTIPNTSADLLRLIGKIAQQLNGVTEGQAAAIHNAATAAPTSGTFSQGDFVLNSAPAVAGAAGSQYIIHGWRCTVSGTPGTWVDVRVLHTDAQPLDATLTAIADGSLGAFSHRNKIINGGFAVNQRAYVSGAATVAGQYTLDRWKVTGTGGITFSTTDNKTTVTIPSGQALQQVIEGLNLQSGTYVLSWEGTAQGKIGAGSLGASGITGSITGGTDTTIEFGPGTVANVQLEFGSVATQFEHRPYGTELALCQRYYWRGIPGADINTHSYASGAIQSWPIMFPVTMRAVPTLSSNFTGATLLNINTPTWSSATKDAGRLLFETTAAATNVYITFAAGNYIAADAEL